MHQKTIHLKSMYSKELLKGTLKPILLQLLKEQGRMYGYEIAQCVKSRTEGRILIREGSLYPTLHSLKHDGLLKVESIQVGNRTRKYYSLTRAGVAKAPEIVQEVHDFFATLQLLLTPNTPLSHG